MAAVMTYLEAGRRALAEELRRLDEDEIYAATAAKLVNLSRGRRAS